MGDWGHGADTDELTWGTRLDSDGRPYEDGDLEDDEDRDEDQAERDRREWYRTGGGWFGEDVTPETRRALYSKQPTYKRRKSHAQQKAQQRRATYKRRRKSKRKQPDKHNLRWWLTRPPRR